MSRKKGIFSNKTKVSQNLYVKIPFKVFTLFVTGGGGLGVGGWGYF